LPASFKRSAQELRNDMPMINVGPVTTSAFGSKAAIRFDVLHFRVVPRADSCTAANGAISLQDQYWTLRRLLENREQILGCAPAAATGDLFSSVCGR
jgi:hypothetical protein